MPTVDGSIFCLQMIWPIALPFLAPKWPHPAQPARRCSLDQHRSLVDPQRTPCHGRQEGWKRQQRLGRISAWCRPNSWPSLPKMVDPFQHSESLKARWRGVYICHLHGASRFSRFCHRWHTFETQNVVCILDTDTFKPFKLITSYNQRHHVGNFNFDMNIMNAHFYT